MIKRNLLLAWLPVLLLCFIVCSFSFAEVPLAPGTQEDTSLNPKTYRNYSLDIPECTSRLIVSITNGAGDLDLFMRWGEPFEAESYEEMLMQSDAWSDTDGTADESIELTNSTLMPVLPGRWYVAPTNWNEYATDFTLSTWLETGMPMPTEPELFLTYDPIEEPLADSDPAYAQPIGTGDIAWGGGTVTIQIGTCPCTEPVDLYFAVQISTIPDELYMLTADGTLQPYSLVGLAPWKTQVTEVVHEAPFGDLLRSSLPPGTYYFYLAAAPVGTFDNFYLWSTFFEIPGAPAPTNIKPYLDQVIDDTVIDFGRLDSKRRNLGVGPALGAIPVYPYPVPPYTAPGVNLQNLCTYIGGGTYLKTLPQLPVTDPNHIDPDQYPDGMTCVFAVVADGDAEAFNFQHILPERMFGRGNIYTAISIPGGVPAGTLIDNYETLNVYNSMVSAYANSGLLSVQPHVRSAGAPGALLPFTAPVEPLRTPPQEFPYVIAFSQGGNPHGIPVAAGQILSESSNPLDPLGLQPSGTIFKVIVEEGSWGQGNARGYIWMIPVTDDFWDLRHSNGTGDPGLWVNDKRVATLTYVGQTIPIIWEAPDDPDVEQSTHDRRHVNPDAIPAGGTVQLEARVQDNVNPQKTAFALVAWPTGMADVEIEKTVYHEHDHGASCPGADELTGERGDPITYCFVIRNTGNTYLNQIRITDTSLGITEANLTLVSGTIPLAPGDTIVYIFETTISSDLTNVATVEANPCDESGNDLLGLADVSNQDSATVSVSSEDYQYLTVSLMLQWDNSQISLVLVAVKDNLNNLGWGVGEPTVYSDSAYPPYTTIRLIPKETGTYIIAAYANGFPLSMLPECKDGQPVQPVPTVDVSFTLTMEQTPYNYFPERETNKYEFGERSTQTFDSSVTLDPNGHCLDNKPLPPYGELRSITTVTVERP